MVCIGINGLSAERLSVQISGKYREAGFKAEVYNGNGSPRDILSEMNNAELNGFNVFIVYYDASELIKYDILIFTFHDSVKSISMLKNIKSGGYIIISSDDYGIFPHILPNGVTVVTCGISDNAAVTFSGISDDINGTDTIQCCIQKYIKTISGRHISPQEFSVRVSGKYPLSEVLVIIAAAIMGDIEETVTKECLFSDD